MKKAFVIFGILAFSVASAQKNGLPNPAKKFQKPATDTFFVPKTFFNSGAQPKLLGNLSHTLPNGSKVYSLPQDNMPCVVPDMSQFNDQVVKPPMLHYNIPNPTFPPPSKVVPLSPDKLKKLQELSNQQKSPSWNWSFK
jgi:hypothetical protein